MVCVSFLNLSPLRDLTSRLLYLDYRKERELEIFYHSLGRRWIIDIQIESTTAH